MLQGQRALDDAGDAGCRLKMPHVGLHRSDHQRPVSIRPVDVCEGVQFDRITKRRACAVRFDILHIGGHQSGVGERRSKHGALRHAVWHREPGAAAVVIVRAATDDGMNRVAVAFCIRQSFEHDHATPFATRVAIRAVIEGGAAARCRQRAQVTHVDRRERRDHRVHTTGNRQRAAARAKRLDREQHRHQR